MIGFGQLFFDLFLVHGTSDDDGLARGVVWPSGERRTMAAWYGKSFEWSQQ
jgi:hypothetical protein